MDRGLSELKASNRILLVDDEQDITTVLKEGLERNGFEVAAYNDPLRAIEQYRPNYYDHHILDIRMPGMSGFDLARQIWLNDSDAQVCFLSSFEIYEEEARRVFKDLNSTCFIKKPMTISALVSHLQIHAAPRQ